MVSKPKSGLSKGLVRTLAQSQSHSHTPYTLQPSPSHSYTYAQQHAISSLCASSTVVSGGLGSFQPINLAPVVSQYHQRDDYQQIASGSGARQSISRGGSSKLASASESVKNLQWTTIQEKQRLRTKGKNREPWPLLPSIPPASAVIASPAYLALLPTWDTYTMNSSVEGDSSSTSTFSATDAILGQSGEPPMVVIPYRTAQLAGLLSPTPTRSRHQLRGYSTTSAPARAAAQVYNAYSHVHSAMPGLLDYPLPPWVQTKQALMDGQAPNFPHDFFYAPPPPPSPGPSSDPPSRAVKGQRSDETHTVLSPAPLAQPHSENTSNGSPGGSVFINYEGNDQSLGRISHPNIPEPDETTVGYAPYDSRLIFKIGASGLAKDRPIINIKPGSRKPSPTPPPRPRSFPLPPIKAPAELDSKSIGEDSYFASFDGICVADGVGGWARSGRGGADAGRWSRLLTHYIRGEIKAWWMGQAEYVENISDKAPKEGGSGWSAIFRKKSDGDGGHIGGIGIERENDSNGLDQGLRRRKLDPVEIMQRGFEKCLACVLSEGIYGSSTCLLALLHHSSLLVANLGDCCLLLVRNGEIVFRTNEMQHAFNFPLQVGTHSRDEPMKDAGRFEVTVEESDVVVMGSDGLMDNLFDEDILDVLAQFAPPTPHAQPLDSRLTSSSGLPPFDPQKLSEALCNKAREVSEEPNATTPFMMRAIEEGIDFVGGKKDDISVVVGVIGLNEKKLELKT